MRLVGSGLRAIVVTLDPGRSQVLHAGGFAEAPARMNHYAWTASETVLQIHGEGPFAIT